jgi:pimeloyl-ACP methyl ester carboxylesterase
MTYATGKPIIIPRDGRELAAEWWGDPDGQPVFLMHGMPGSRLGPRPRGIVLERMGIRLISYDRPGYGLSSRHAGRTVADAALDVEKIADHLGLDEFAVIGRSGGGPHALACAAHLRGRIQRAAILVSFAPPDATGLVWNAGMTAKNVQSFAETDRTAATAPAGAPPMIAGIALQAAGLQEDPESLIKFLQPQLTESDRRFVEDRAMRNLLTATYAEAVLKGDGGWIDDNIAIRSQWDFKFEDVFCPVLLWHGGDDRFSPVSHTLWLAEKLSAVRKDGPDQLKVAVQIDSGAAHFAAFEVFVDVLNWVAEPEPLAAPTNVRTAAAGRAPGGCESRSAEQPHSDARDRSALPVGR